MKSLAACTIVLALAACGTSSSSTTSGTSGSGGTGVKSTGTTGTASGGHGSTTGSASAAGSSTGSPLDTKCTYDSSTGDDSCTDEGYECSAEFDNGTSGKCVLPEDLGICDGDINGDVGCQDGGIPSNDDGGVTQDLVCTSGFMNANNPSLSLCLFPCSTPSDCPFLIQTCLPSPYDGCFIDTCGQDSTTGAFVGPYFGTCAVAAAADGQCFSFNTGTYAECIEDGTADVGEPCNPTFRYGAFSECKYGNFCWPTASGDGGLCFPITIDGGCGAPGNDVIGETGADWGICAQDCTASMACDGGAAVGTTCQSLTGAATPTSACLP